MKNISNIKLIWTKKHFLVDIGARVVIWVCFCSLKVHISETLCCKNPLKKIGQPYYLVFTQKTFFSKLIYLKLDGVAPLHW